MSAEITKATRKTISRLRFEQYFRSGKAGKWSRDWAWKLWDVAFQCGAGRGLPARGPHDVGVAEDPGRAGPSGTHDK